MEKSLLCERLRYKEMYHPRAARPDAEDHGTTVYWCLRTFKPIGPDADPCDKESCRAGRSCFEGERV